jgi:type VI secretion system protein ImpC
MSTDARKAPAQATTTTEAQAPAGGLLGEILKVSKTRPAEVDSITDAVARFTDLVVKQEMTVGTDTEAMLNRYIDKIDQQIGAQLDAILHHAEFQKLESAWRGLKYLVYNSNTNPMLKIKVLDVSRRELLRDLQRASEFTESALYKVIYTNEYNMPGGVPYAAMIGDFRFNVSVEEDMDLLGRVTEVAAAAHAPFLAAADPESFGFESWTELPAKRSLAEIFDHRRDPRYIKWNSFRESEDSRYTGLCLPRVLLRSPHDSGNDEAKFGFRYREDVDGTVHDKYLWGNSAYALGTRLTEAFERYHWCQTIRGRENGGLVQGLPIHTFQTDDGHDYKVPTEVAIDDSRGRELEQLGFIPLCHYKHEDNAVFFTVQSCQKAKSYRGERGDQATASANLSTSLPYVFMVSRFAHYLKIMMRDKIGAFMSRENCERFLNDWIKTYVLLNDDAPASAKAERPLRDAQIEVTEDPRRPGCYRAVCSLRPHYLLNELTASMRLVSELPPPRR